MIIISKDVEINSELGSFSAENNKKEKEEVTYDEFVEGLNKVIEEFKEEKGIG